MASVMSMSADVRLSSARAASMLMRISVSIDLTSGCCDDRRAELHALRGVVARLLVRRLGDADRLRRDARAGRCS